MNLEFKWHINSGGRVGFSAGFAPVSPIFTRTFKIRTKYNTYFSYLYFPSSQEYVCYHCDCTGERQLFIQRNECQYMYWKRWGAIAGFTCRRCSRRKMTQVLNPNWTFSLIQLNTIHMHKNTNCSLSCSLLWKAATAWVDPCSLCGSSGLSAGLTSPLLSQSWGSFRELCQLQSYSSDISKTISDWMR